MLNAFVATLRTRTSHIFTSTDLDFDGQNLSLFYRHSGTNGGYVHLIVDFTCMEDGHVTVHARPDHIFERYITGDDDALTLTLDDEQPFTGGDSIPGWEFDDGHGNILWTFDFPNESDRISNLFIGLAKIAALHFEL